MRKNWFLISVCLFLVIGLFLSFDKRESLRFPSSFEDYAGSYMERRNQIISSPFSDSKIRVFTRVEGFHIPVSEYSSYHHDLKYYSNGLGYFFSGKAQVIPSQFIESGFFDPSIELLHSYVMYKLQKYYFEIANQENIGIRTKDNIELLDDPSWDIVKSRFKAQYETTEEIKVGDFFLFPDRGKKVIRKRDYLKCHESRSPNVCLADLRAMVGCHASKHGVAEVKGFIGPFVELHFSNLEFIPGQEIVLPETYCKSGETILVAKEKIKDLNEKYLNESFRRNAQHQILVKDKIGQRFFSEVDYSKRINICSGTKSGVYYPFAKALANNLEDRGVPAGVIESNGSNENLVSFEYGRCNALISQKDAYINYQETYRLSNMISYQKPVIKELGFLVCHRSSELHTVGDLSGSHVVHLGGRNSGSAFTFGKLAEEYKNLSKVRKRFTGGRKALREILKGEADCLFTVSSPQANLIKIVGSFPELKLVSIKSAKSNIYDPVILEPNDFPGLVDADRRVETIAIDALVIFERHWTEIYPGDFIKTAEALSSLLSTTGLDTLDVKAINSSQSINICTGGEDGFYHEVGQRILENLPEFEVKNIQTSGSFENLRMLQQNECDFVLAQGDVYQHFLQVVENASMYQKLENALFTESAFLICHRGSGISSRNDLRKGHRISVGGRASGSSFSWKGFGNRGERIEFFSSREALRKVLEREIDCFFSVRHVSNKNLSSNIIGFADIHPSLKLVSLKSSHLRTDFLNDGFLSSLRWDQEGEREVDIETPKVGAQLIFSRAIFGDSNKVQVLNRIKELIKEDKIGAGE